LITIAVPGTGLEEELMAKVRRSIAVVEHDLGGWKSG